MSANPTELARIPASVGQMADEAQALCDEHKEVVIENRVQFSAGAEVLRSIKGLLKGLEAERVKVTGPMNAALDQVNDWFRGPRAKLEKAERTMKDALAKFENAETAKIREQERLAAEQARVEREELERRAAKAEAAGKVEKAAELTTRAAAVVPATPALAPVKARGASFTDVWDTKVVDASKVPREYLVVDEAKIRAVVKALKGAIQIPGVEITHRRDMRSGS